MPKRKPRLVSIVIPAHNERENLEVLLKRIDCCLRPSSINHEIVIVDDNSTDGTSEFTDRAAAKNKRIQVIHRTGGASFGKTMKAGFTAAKGDVIVPLMGDLSDDPADILKLLSGLENGFDVAIASRFLPSSSVEGYPRLKMLANRCFNIFAAVIFGLEIKDLTNAFKAYRREVLESILIESKGFEINAEIPLKAHLLGFTIIEVPANWRGRKSGVSKLKLGQMGPRYIRVVLDLLLHGVRGRK